MADSINDVMSRLSQLETQAQSNLKGNAAWGSNKRKVETIHFGNPDNQGSYLIIPLPNPIYGSIPYVQIRGVRQFKVTKTFKDKSYDYTRKILPVTAYDIVDPQAQTFRLYSPLTSDDLELHKEACRLWDDLYRKMGGYKKQAERTPAESKQLLDMGMGSKNYTIFNSYVMYRYKGTDVRNTVRSNYGALFILPSLALSSSVNENIASISAMQFGGNTDWVNNIYNDNWKSRSGNIMLTVTRQQGYKVTVTHSITSQPIEIVMTDEEREDMMKDPMEGFIGASNIPLGEESKPAGTRKLFSAEYYRTMIDELKRLNASFDANLQGVTAPIEEPKRGPIQGTVDPLLNQVPPQPAPEAQPQTAHIDPFSGQNVQGGNSPFPSFGQATTSAPFNNPFPLQGQGTGAAAQGQGIPF